MVKEKNEKMKIGKLSNLTGVSRDTIRLYESRGMLRDISRPFEWNNYKDYGDVNVRRIKCIKHMQKFSFTLKEIKELFDHKDANPNVRMDRSKVFKSKLQVIEKEIEDLKRTRDALIEIIND